jgi:hypothetical protein
VISISQQYRVHLEILDVPEQKFMNFVLFLFGDFLAWIEQLPLKRVRNVLYYLKIYFSARL